MASIDLTKLSRNEKLRLLDLIEEKKRRIRDAAPLYSPNEGQAPVHLSTKTLRCVFSGNGAGNTVIAGNR